MFKQLPKGLVKVSIYSVSPDEVTKKLIGRKLFEVLKKNISLLLNDFITAR